MAFVSCGFALKISVIMPLFDRRGSGWQQLESALTQTLDRRQFEVIAVTAQPFDGDLPLDARAGALLKQCDAVVHVDVDPNRSDQEIPLLLAGYERASGDLLFFTEGHTVLEPDCCATIAAHFRDHPHAQVAWAQRHHCGRTPLGALIGIHSKQHERLAAGPGGFWVGANSVIARGLFEQLGRLDAAYLRFAERVLGEHIIRKGIPIGQLPKPLATHHDDISMAQLLGIGAAAGAAKFRYYNRQPMETGATATRVRHWIYHGANRNAIALVLLPLSRTLARCFLTAAASVFVMSRATAYRIFVLGFGFADLSGYCSERLRSARWWRGRRDTAGRAASARAPQHSMDVAKTRG